MTASFDTECMVEMKGLGLVSTQVDVVSPGHLTKWASLPAILLEVLLLPEELAWLVQVCISLDNGPPSCAEPAIAIDWPPPLPSELGDGWHTLEAYVSLNNGTRVDCHLREHDTVSFQIESSSALMVPLPPKSVVPKRCAVVSAANAPYYERLSNLVGSLHHWEPDLPIRAYDLGLTPHQASCVSSWNNTSLHKLSAGLPSHVMTEVSLVGWKAWVVLDSLRAVDNETTVLWLDANAEVRRPLDDILLAIDRDGYFLTVAGHRFPTDKTVRPSTLSFFGCRASFASLPECTSAVVGVKPHSWLHAHILPAVHECSVRLDCLYPPDAIGNVNQRRDQSVLNAALCASGRNYTCHADRRYWMWHGQRAFLPTSDQAQFNDIVLFSRRGHAHVYSPKLIADN